MVNALSSFRDGAYANPNRQLLGATQEQWLSEGLAASTARGATWQVLVQQVLMGKLKSPRGMLEFWADPASPYYRDYFGEHKRTIVFCAGGGRSVYATLALKEMGYSNVAHLADGFRGWKDADEPIEDVAATSRWVRRPKEG